MVWDCATRVYYRAKTTDAFESYQPSHSVRNIRFFCSLVTSWRPSKAKSLTLRGNSKFSCTATELQHGEIPRTGHLSELAKECMSWPQTDIVYNIHKKNNIRIIEIWNKTNLIKKKERNLDFSGWMVLFVNTIINDNHRYMRYTDIDIGDRKQKHNVNIK